MDMNDEARLRVVALQAATESASNCGCCRNVVERADEYFEWLTRRTPATITLTVGEVEKQSQQEEQNPMQIHDDEQFDVTLEVKDSKGFDIQGDQITVTVDNNDVVSVQESQDSGGAYTIVAGNPGSAVVTFNAGTDDNGHEVVVTEAVDVVPGNVATVQIAEGTVSKQGAQSGGSTPAPGDGTGSGSASGTPVDSGTTDTSGTAPEGDAGAPAI
jgi:hypothetical protein